MCYHIVTVVLGYIGGRFLLMYNGAITFDEISASKRIEVIANVGKV